MAEDFFSHFQIIRDPRIERTKKHPLESILFLAICAVICGADHWSEIEQFGEDKEDWLRRYVELPHGIPSHDTIGRVFALLDPEEFQKCFTNWIRSIFHCTQGQVIAIDGKTLRRSHDRSKGMGALHLVQAWASENHLMLGAVKTEGDSNEIPAIPELLKILDLKGAIVTLDAMGTQTEVAEKIVEKGADYVMSLKGNHGLLHEDVRTYWADEKLLAEADSYEVVEKGHGRIEQRRYWMTNDVDWLETEADWSGLRSMGMVEAQRTVEGQATTERRYYLSSLKADARELAKAIRSHWGIENGLHWVLDIAFREDECRVRMGHAAQNFALLRRLAVNLLKQEKGAKVGIKGKRLKAGWGSAYLEKVLWGH
jgi:predicted transposase YbfD/YdcC